MNKLSFLVTTLFSFLLLITACDNFNSASEDGTTSVSFSCTEESYVTLNQDITINSSSLFQDLGAGTTTVAITSGNGQPKLYSHVDSTFIFEKSLNGDFLYFTGESPSGVHIYKYNISLKTAVQITNQELIYSKRYEHEVLNGVLYFRASDASEGSELWSLDFSTDVVSRLPSTIAPGVEGSDPYALTSFQGKLYFSALSPSMSRHLFRSYDPNTDTFETYNFAGSSFIRKIVAFNNDLYYHRNGTVLYKFDPVNKITTSIDVPGTNPRVLDFLGPNGVNKIILRGRNVENGEGFFEYNSSTELITSIDFSEIDTTTNRFLSDDYFSYEGKIFYTKQNNLNGNELWAYDSNSDNSALYMDINAGSGSSSPKSFFLYNNKMYFNAYTGSTYNLYSIDSSFNLSIELETLLIEPKVIQDQLYFFESNNLSIIELSTNSYVVNPLVVNNFPKAIIANTLATVGNYIVFQSDIDEDGTDSIYSYNNATNSLKLIIDVGHASLDHGKVLSNNLYFPAEINGELFSFKFNPENNEITSFCNLSTFSYSAIIQSPYLISNSDKIYLPAKNIDDQEHFLIYSSVEKNIKILKHKDLDVPLLLPHSAFELNNKTYFSAYLDENGDPSNFVYDPATDRTSSINNDAFPVVGYGADFYIDSSSAFYNGKYYYSGYSNSSGWEIFSYDLASGSSTIQIDYAAGPESFSPSNLILLNDKIYFIGKFSSSNSLGEYNPSLNTVTNLNINLNKIYAAIDNRIYYETGGTTTSSIHYFDSISNASGPVAGLLVGGQRPDQFYAIGSSSYIIKNNYIYKIDR